MKSDLARKARSYYEEQTEKDWLNSKYTPNFSILNCPINFKWSKNREMDVLLARFFTKMIPTNNLLHKLNLKASPLCDECKVNETVEHLFTECNKYSSLRKKLQEKVFKDDEDVTDFAALLQKPNKSRKAMQAVGEFLREADL